jgi:hypothetical protein
VWGGCSQVPGEAYFVELRKAEVQLRRIPLLTRFVELGLEDALLSGAWTGHMHEVPLRSRMSSA